MDPLSIGASVGSLSGACLVTLKNLNELVGKFRDAPKTLRDLSSETKIISISLSQLRNALVSDQHSVLTQTLLKPDIRNVLDVALTGCKMTLSCLETEIHSLTANIAADQKLSFTDRAKVAWKDDKFKELLSQLTRQHNAIAILQQSFQMKSLGDILYLLVSSKNLALIQKVAEDTNSLRGLYPKSNEAKSFLDSLQSTGANETEFSMISEQQFEFDDLVTNSQAYRRVLVAATHALKKNMSGTAGEIGGVSDLSSEGAQLGKGGNNTEGANQSRKMSAAPGLARGLKNSHTPTSGEDSKLQDNHSQQSTINDPHSFAQQIRGYLDHVEGESRNAAKENAHLREKLEENEKAAGATTYQLQIAIVRAENAEKKLEAASKENKEEVSKLQNWINKLRAESDYVMERLELAETKAAQKEASHKLDEEEYERLAREFFKITSMLEAQSKDAERMTLDLETSKAETASAKKELEEAQAVQKDLSALFQKGNDILQGKRKQVIDREYWKLSKQKLGASKTHIQGGAA